MAKNGKRGTRTPTPAKAGDTLDRIANFALPRDLYESERKEHVIALRARLSELKSIRKRVAESLGIAVADEKEVSKVIAMYEGDAGILALWHNDAEEEEHTAEEVKKGGKDHRQRELPIGKVPSESTPETRASTEPVGVAAIDDLVAHVQPFAPSDLDWDAFRRNAIEMTKDERMAVHEYAERYHQATHAPASANVAMPSIPGSLHTLFSDLSPTYEKALGDRPDVLWPTDMARAMAKAKRKGKGPEKGAQAAGEPVTAGVTAKQLAALRKVADGGESPFGLSPGMWGKLMTLGLAYIDSDGKRAATEKGLAVLAATAPAEPVTGASAAEENDDLPLPEAKGPDPEAENDPSLTDEAWANIVTRADPDAPVEPLAKLAEAEAVPE